MIEKTMRKLLRKKVDAWLQSITDPMVVKAIKEDLVITGGCFASMIHNEAPKDFDCYFRTKETTIKVAEYYVDIWNKAHKDQENKLGITTNVFVLDGAEPSKELLSYYNITRLDQSPSHMISNTPPERVKIIFPSDGVVGDPKAVRSPEELGTAVENVTEMDEVAADAVLDKVKTPFAPVFLSTNAITLSSGIQIVVRFYGEPEKIHETYDFVHTKAYYLYKEKKIEIPKEVYEAAINKTLMYTGSKYPVCSVFRVRKFIAKGWTINAGQLLKMALQISELDLMDIDVLEDQLVGVDSLYFMNLIAQFRQRDVPLTTNYVISIIDKIF